MAYRLLVTCKDVERTHRVPGVVMFVYVRNTVSNACKDVRLMTDVLLSCVRLDRDAEADKSEGVAPRGSPPC